MIDSGSAQFRFFESFLAVFLTACGTSPDGTTGAQGGAGNAGAANSGAGGQALGAGGAGGTSSAPGGGGSGNAAGSSGTSSSGGTAGGSAGASGSGGSGPIGTPITDLPVGEWTDVTPEGSLGATGVYHLGIAPSDPAIVYLASDKEGMYKTTDASKTWLRLGNPDGYLTSEGTDYLEDPCNIAVDPSDPDHVYATEGVDGGRDGFWVSLDGGATWEKPAGFNAVATAVGGPGQDVVQMAVDPLDFNHVLLSPHSDWGITAAYSSGILESTDGGDSWTYHLPPGDAWAAGSKGIHFLHHPPSGQGDASTWLVCDEGAGFWRTTNAGTDWVKVADAQGPHGGNQSYYTPDGVLYAGAVYQPWRSTDNGATWESVDGVPSTAYRTVFGAGGLLYTHATEGDSLFHTSPEGDGASWTTDDAHGLSAGGTWEMGFDPVNQILYAANKAGGFWALRIAE